MHVGMSQAVTSWRWFVRIIVGVVLIFAFLLFIYWNFTYSTLRYPPEHPVVSPSQAKLPLPPPLPDEQIIRVLSIDGGGVKGILPLHVLKALEEQSGVPANELFDLMVGTSTGGLIVAGLSRPNADNTPAFTAEELLESYRVISKEIFSAGWFHQVMTLNGVLGAKFSTIGLDRIMQEQAGNVRMSQLLTPVSIPGYDLAHNQPVIFSSCTVPGDTSYDHWVAHVLSAITAAPTAFPPVHITDVAHEHPRIVVDASIYVNNPGELALAEAMRLYPNHQYMLVSLGTGLAIGYTGETHIAGWGISRWVATVYDVAFAGRCFLTDHTLLLDQANPQTPLVAYYRLNADIPDMYDSWIYENETQVAGLEAAATQMVQANESLIKELATLLAGQTQPQPPEVQPYPANVQHVVPSYAPTDEPDAP